MNVGGAGKEASLLFIIVGSGTDRFFVWKSGYVHVWSCVAIPVGVVEKCGIGAIDDVVVAAFIDDVNATSGFLWFEHF